MSTTVTRAKPIQTGPAEFQRVSTEDVLFDPKNPRFGSDTRTISQSALQEKLMAEPHLASLLIDSFVSNGFIDYEPLVVRREGKKYVVIEGNRRLAAVKHILAHRHDYPPQIVADLEQVPVLVFHEKADASHVRDIRTYLGVRHLVGYREWPAESKAIFLDEQIKSKSDVKRILNEFGIKKADITRYLIPYRVKKAAADILEEFDTEDSSFWMLGEALARSGIKEYIELAIDAQSLKIKSFNKKKLRNLLEFLYGTQTEGRQGSLRAVGARRITETRQLTRLARVLANTRASQKLEEGSTLEEAEIYTGSREEALQSLVTDLRITLQRIIALKPSADDLEQIKQQFRQFENAVKSFAN